MSYFSQSKGDADKRAPARADLDVRPASAPAGAAAETVSTLGHGMLITGNVVCTGAVQIAGRVVGDIHAAQLVLREGAQVEGKIVAPDTVVEGTFKGTIHANSVKLQGHAVVEGEIFNKSLTVEQDVQFEGVSRRLDKPVEPPSTAQVEPRAATSTAEVISFGPAVERNPSPTAG